MYNLGNLFRQKYIKLKLNQLYLNAQRMIFQNNILWKEIKPLVSRKYWLGNQKIIFQSCRPSLYFILLFPVCKRIQCIF